MSSNKKSPELYIVTIEQPHTELTADMVKINKQLIPSAMSGGKAQKSEQTKKPERELEVKHNPLKKKVLKKQPFAEAITQLFRAPDYTEQPGTMAILLLLILLSHVAHLIVGILPPLPAVLLNTSPEKLTPVLSVLLSAIQGPSKWCGDGWKLLRPWIIRPRLSMCETKPSISVIDYIGGKIPDIYCGKSRKFCFPYVNSAFVLLPGLPPSVSKQITSMSPLSLPILFKGGKAEDNRSTLALDADQLGSCNLEKLEELKKLSQACYLGIMIFLQWFCNSKKELREWKRNMTRFQPFKKNGQFSQPKSDLQTILMCAALSLLEQYLRFASDETEWITEEQAVEILLHYWRLVLPESAPQEEKEQNTQYTYNDFQTFYRFLLEYFFPTYQGQILQGRQGYQGTMGLIRPLDGVDYIIIPRTILLEAYSKWLPGQHISGFDLSTTKSEAAVQRSLLEAGIPFKHESGNPATWRYPFYGKDKKTSGGGMISCMALPVSQLPESVQTVFGTLFGGPNSHMAIPNAPEAAMNGSDGVKPL
ncbi:hypothetical protein [Lawsonibacter sp. JLR.KK007]|mgnify:CR=1 FL=1|uniref:hypothetical protein n=1 Tax=Lawsonibacter sp. JLR.KK007 TaxID=3114293 RepID=UPI002FF1C53E